MKSTRKNTIINLIEKLVPNAINKGNELSKTAQYTQALVSYKLALGLMTDNGFNGVSLTFDSIKLKSANAMSKSINNLCAKILECMSICYLELKKTREEKKCLNLAVSLAGINALNQMKLLRISQDEGRYQQVIETAKMLLAKKSKVHLADEEKGEVHARLVLLAKMDVFDIDEKEIEVHISEATRLGYKDISQLAQGLGLQCFTNGDNHKAISLYKYALDEYKKQEDTFQQYWSLTLLGSAYLEDDQPVNAVTAYENCVLLYTAPEIASYCKQSFATLAYALANIFCGSHSDKITPDIDKALKYYQLAIEMDYPEHPDDLNGLAVEYCTGIDVAKDLNKAIPLLRRAVKHKNHPSFNPCISLNLAMCLLESSLTAEHEEGLELLKTVANKKDNPHAMNLLGTIYLNDSNAFKEAFECFEIAENLGLTIAKFNKAFLFLKGFRRSKDAEALENVKTQPELYSKLKQEQARAYINEVKTIFLEVINEAPEEINETSLAKLKLALDKFSKIEPALSEEPVRLSLNEETKVEIKPSTLEIPHELSLLPKIEISDFCRVAIQQVWTTAKNRELKPENRIKEILDDFDSENDESYYAMVLQRLGVLTEDSLNNRTFHESELARVRTVLSHVTQKLRSSPFPKVQTVQAIEGISKLQLNATIEEYVESITVFYQHTLKHLGEFSVPNLVNIIYSASRLDPAHPIFSTSILPSIINAVLLKMKQEQCDEQSISNLLYALALFNASSLFLLPLKPLQDFVKRAQNTPKTIDVKNLYQRYLGLFYFTNTYPDLAIDNGLLANWQKTILSTTPEVKTSKFQLSLVATMKAYVDGLIEEDRVGILPVDAVVRFTDHIFLFQADGPAHRLHGAPNEPTVPKLKTIFRNHYLVYAGRQQFKEEIEKHQKSLSVPCISYDEWDKAESLKAKLDLFENKFQIKFNNPWTLQISKTDKKSQKSIHRVSFFSPSIRPHSNASTVQSSQKEKANSRLGSDGC